LEKILLIGTGGFFGAIARFGLQSLVKHWTAYQYFPLSTLVINGLGCLAIGMFWEVWREHVYFQTLYLFFVIGFLGSFTTFSAFGLETFELLRSGRLLFALSNIGMQVTVGLLGVGAGAWIGRIAR
jgi:CrcB protein